jgi:hypothetical protein
MAGLTNLYEGDEKVAVYACVGLKKRRFANCPRSQILEALVGEDPHDFNEALVEILEVRTGVYGA